MSLRKLTWLGDTFGESNGETVAPGEWHLGNVGDVWTIIDFRWPRVEGRRVDNDSSFWKFKE